MKTIIIKYSSSATQSVLRSLMRKISLIAGIVCVLLLGGCKYYTYNGPGFKTIEENPKAKPWFHVYRPADMMGAIEKTGHLLPVIVWANGGCFRADFPWQPLFKRWAAEGYVVLALSASPVGGMLGISTVSNQGALIDWALNESSYSDLLDSSRVVAAGNSCGGVTALNLAARDPRVAAVFVLSGSSELGFSSKKVMQAIKVPVGYITGGPTDIAGKPAKTDYANMVQDIPAMLVSRTVGGHLFVSTRINILEQEADISYHWLDLVLYGSKSSYDALMENPLCPTCTEGEWNMASRHLDTLVK